MDVVGENEALQQFFEGKSQVLRESLNNFWWQQKYSNCLKLVEEERKKKEPPNPKALFTQSYCVRR